MTDAATRRRATRRPAVTPPARTPPRWLLFVHQLPPSPSRVRVRTWRRLQQIGALVLKQALYVLPDSPASREDFEWLKAEIEAAGGHATVFAADTVDNWSSGALTDEFRRMRERDYAALARAAERAVKAAERARKTAGRTRAPHQSRRAAGRVVGTFRQRLADIEAIDFFNSAGRDRVATLVAQLQQAVAGGPPQATPEATTAASRAAFRARLWVTRPRPGIDRLASAWLIARFIDPDARFAFMDQPPEAGDGVAFDMFGVEFSHRGAWCTFETLAHTFALTDPGVARLAAIVHDLDLKDGRFGAPEAGTVGALVDGLQALYADDHALLERGMTMFDALHRSFARASARRPRPLPGRRRR